MTERQKMARNGRETRKGESAFLVAMAGGSTVRAAARRAGIGERTAFRRLGEPDFRKKVSAMRAATIERATGRLARASTKAAATLDRLLRSKDERIRLAAGRWILRMLTHLRDHADHEERLLQLEAKLSKRR